ncbi:MAG: hypothetical protein Ct9H300mP32_3140 [Verrucomicrobiota bacterium]|nr:MAG: hypothetical protein Ct9H300mP32_3140 [Verrucomicrobiota bacterium]
MISAARGLPIGDDFSVRKKTATDVGVGRETVESGVGGLSERKNPPRAIGWPAGLWSSNQSSPFCGLAIHSLIRSFAESPVVSGLLAAPGGWLTGRPHPGGQRGSSESQIRRLEAEHNAVKQCRPALTIWR